MRPIEKGVAPNTYTDYRDAIADLEDRLGRFCSYCERPLKIGLAVEHVAPKELRPDLALVWENFLLACLNCNSVKGEKVVSIDGVLWPDIHNTLLALAYLKGGFVKVAKGLHSVVDRRARALIDLVGLDRHKAKGWPKPARRDQRWRDREEAWAAAELCRDFFESSGGSDKALGLVVVTAKGYGFFSVWFFVFASHSLVKRALIDAFPSTAATCFNSSGAPIRRPGSVL
ncbi:MAG: HNH endonuclease [Candidatus Tectomicrobia bacterium]|nr:HNH endonuclease [Candidatus Tectomicrobia bacterium]